MLKTRSPLSDEFRQSWLGYDRFSDQLVHFMQLQNPPLHMNNILMQPKPYLAFTISMQIGKSCKGKSNISNTSNNCRALLFSQQLCVDETLTHTRRKGVEIGHRIIMCIKPLGTGHWTVKEGRLEGKEGRLQLNDWLTTTSLTVYAKRYIHWN